MIVTSETIEIESHLFMYMVYGQYNYWKEGTYNIDFTTLHVSSWGVFLFKSKLIKNLYHFSYENQ